jgi:hypothetical protein
MNNERGMKDIFLIVQRRGAAAFIFPCGYLLSLDNECLARLFVAIFAA